MSKTDLIYRLLKQDLKLSRSEKILLEIKFFLRIYHELYEIFKSRYREYHPLIKSNLDQDETMYNIKFMQEMVNDILATKEYSLLGISTHTRIPEDVLSDIAAGININPTLELSRRLFELHIEVRHDLYDKIMQKFTSEYCALSEQS